ncbi:MAG: hypothetical protein ACTSQJ_09510 [Promethearchaeota archaeon]
MKSVNLKAFMVLSLFIAALFTMPIMAFGQDDDDDSGDNDQYGFFSGYSGGFGGIFGSGIGKEAAVFDLIFMSLFQQGLSIDDYEMLDNVYILSANMEKTYNGTYEFAKENDERSIHMLPYVDENDDGFNDYDQSGINGYAYCVVDKTGGFDWNLTVGAAVTIAIWDYDNSFIDAFKKIVDTLKIVEEKGNNSAEAIAALVELLSWLLLNINNIFTGDELFVLNPFTWQTLNIRPWKVAQGDKADMQITKTWRETGWDWEINPDTDTQIAPAILTLWNDTANATKDSYMQWLLRNTGAQKLLETVWTQFSFDIIQLWVKTFHIEINLDKLVEPEPDWREVFEGVDIDFYLFTHHLAGAFLYDDTDNNGVISVKYDVVKNETTDDPIMINGTEVEVPTTSEVTHRLILGDVGKFNFIEPEADEDAYKVSWGLELENTEIAPVPVGVDLDSYLGTPQESLDFVYFGVEFIPTDPSDMEKNDEGDYEASGIVKLEHNFAPWNGGAGAPINNVNGLDLAIIYLSSIFHFHLVINNTVTEPEDPETEVSDDDFNNETREVRVGNYLDPDSEDKLDFIDIGGYDYQLGADFDGDKKPDAGATSHTPNTALVPLALWTYEAEAHNTSAGKTESTADTQFRTDVSLEMSFNVLFYGICYSEWNGTGAGIWHDPTFTVYMVFTPESAGFWALILLVAGLALLGIATILIKRRKDARF